MGICSQRWWHEEKKVHEINEQDIINAFKYFLCCNPSCEFTYTDFDIELVKAYKVKIKPISDKAKEYLKKEYEDIIYDEEVDF